MFVVSRARLPMIPVPNHRYLVVERCWEPSVAVQY